MDLAGLETALTTWVEASSGLKLHWRRQEPKALPYPFVEAELLVVRSKGHDEKVWTFDSDTDTNGLTLTGVRALTVSVHFLSLAQALGASSRFYAEKFRTLAYSPSNMQTLFDANIALVETLGLVDNDFEDRSGRVVSQVTLDLLMEMRSSFTDPVFAGDYIKKVDLTSGGLLTDEFGNPIVDEDGNYLGTEETETITVSAG